MDGVYETLPLSGDTARDLLTKILVIQSAFCLINFNYCLSTLILDCYKIESVCVYD